MNRVSLRVVAIVLIFFAALARPVLSVDKVSEQTRVQLSCIREFGAPIDSALNLFAVNQQFVLQLTFDRHHRLSQFAIKPKYFFDEAHPEWNEPDSFPLLSWKEFEQLVGKLERLQPKGKLTVPVNKIAFVSNDTRHYRKGYEKAVLEWGQCGPRENPDSGIRYVYVLYGRLNKIR